MNQDDIENFINKIDQIIFKDNFEYIKLNPKDYSKFVEKIGFKRFEPETQISMLKVGIVGYLKGPNQEPAKTIWVDKTIESGSIHATKIF